MTAILTEFGRTQAELDAQFTLDSIKDLEGVRARRTAEAEKGLARFGALRNVPYGSGAAQTLNLFPAVACNGPSPVQVFIHGGFWQSMEAAQFSFLARGFVPYGAALAIIDYPLVPAVRLADIVQSCRAAIAWCYDKAAAYGLDRDRIFISGNSAGGHLVAEILDCGWTSSFGLPRNVIKGGTAISGLYDLAPVAASFQNDVLRLTDDEVARFSPIRRALDIEAPVIAAVGGREQDEFLRQTDTFAAALRSMNVEVTHMVVPTTDHITVVLDALADPEAPLNKAVRRQMKIG